MPKVYEKLERYFEELDSVPLSENGIFTSNNDKERYETLFMYSYQKYKAALYHYRNVRTFIKEKESIKKSSETLNSIKKREKMMKGRLSVSFTVEKYVYELSAFLEALKSSIDFLCTACSTHIRGIELDSVSTLIKLVKKEISGPIIDDVRENLEWLDKLRSYRHHVVHRLVLTTSNGYESHWRGGITKVSQYPIVIPESPPSYVPDTRKKREMEMIEDETLGLNSSWSEERIKTTEGEEEVIDFSFDFTPSPGFIRIENFMKSQLCSFEQFFAQIIQSLTELEFNVISF